MAERDVQSMPGSLVVIGGGVMGWAIVEGGIRAGVLRGDGVIVAEPDAGRRAGFATLGIGVGATVGEAWRIAGERGGGGDELVAVLAVKPQMFEGVAAELRSLGEWDRGHCAVVSIMAGVRSATIRERLGAGVRVVRAMPNTPGRIGQGVSGVAGGPGATEADVAMAERLFAALGPVVVRIDESLMDAFTALAGSGPAYLFYLAEAMERAAVEVGFDAATARQVVSQTLRGAAELLVGPGGGGGGDPAALRGAVTSKGGTTAAAIASLEQDGVMAAWVRAIGAARDRGRELGRG